MSVPPKIAASFKMVEIGEWERLHDQLAEARAERDDARRSHGLWMNAGVELLARAEAAEAEVPRLLAALDGVLALPVMSEGNVAGGVIAARDVAAIIKHAISRSEESK